MGYALQTLWHEKSRYLAGVGAVAFSAVLMALQFGLMLGLFTITSTPIDNTDPFNVWIGAEEVQSVDNAQPIPISHIGRIGSRPGVRPPEPMVAMYGRFQKPESGSDLCFILGCHLDRDAAGAAKVLTPEHRAALTEPFSIILDESDMPRMQLKEIGDTAKINGKEVRLRGKVSGLKSLAAPWIFCSLHTAKELQAALLPPDHATYLLARCESEERAETLVEELKQDYPDMMVYTAEQFSYQTRKYWLLRTKAGVAIGYAALLGLAVGALVTMQTLYAATIASAREYATLFALGIPRIHVYGLVMSQAFWVGIFGILVALPVVNLLALGAEAAGTRVILHPYVLAGSGVVTLSTALVAGLFALRSVRTIEPMSLLR